MKFFNVITLLGAATLVSSQVAFPPCAVPCIEESLKKTNCAADDAVCQCTSPHIQADVTSCLLDPKTGCSTDDLTKVQQIAVENCANAGKSSVSQIASSIGSDVSSRVSSVTAAVSGVTSNPTAIMTSAPTTATPNSAPKAIAGSGSALLVAVLALLGAF